MFDGKIVRIKDGTLVAMVEWRGSLYDGELAIRPPAGTKINPAIPAVISSANMLDVRSTGDRPVAHGRSAFEALMAAISAPLGALGLRVDFSIPPQPSPSRVKEIAEQSVLGLVE